MLPDIDAINSYNGATNGVLQDYSPVENPQTDQPASGAVQQQGSTAMMTRTLPRAYCTFLYNGSSTVLQEHDAVWGNSAPVAPAPSRVSTGLFNTTWPSTVADAIGTNHSVNMRRGWANIESTGTMLVAFVTRLSANQAQIRIVNSSSAVTDPTGFPVTVWIV